MSFQITVLKVLAGHPGGRASLDELRRAVAILISSGTDWPDRTKRLAARAPGLEIFTRAFVLRDAAGWQITETGRLFLAALEAPIQKMPSIEEPCTPVLLPVHARAAAPLPRSTNTKRRRARHRRTAGRRRRAVA